MPFIFRSRGHLATFGIVLHTTIYTDCVGHGDELMCLFFLCELSNNRGGGGGGGGGLLLQKYPRIGQGALQIRSLPGDKINTSPVGTNGFPKRMYEHRTTGGGEVCCNLTPARR